jgi:OHCU decarboxylase
VTTTLAALNAMPADSAAELFRSCCGASRWVSAMVAARPYTSCDTLLYAADEFWSRLGPDDWHEAFSHHPRIGEHVTAVQQNERAASWSAGEQAGVADAAAKVQEQLAAANRAYEDRFGHIYIVCASGKTADELLAIAHQRLHNEPDAELRIAVAEQHAITRLRLGKLFTETS